VSGFLFILRKLWEDRLARLGLLIIALLVVVAAFAPWLAPFPDDAWAINPANRLRPPSWTHPFGTDRMGADIFSRVLLGARITILIALIAVGTALVVGVPLGLIAGFGDGWLSDLIMRVADMFLAIPQIILAIAIAQTLGPSLPNVILALSATFWPWFTRLVFAETRALRKETFIEATIALGATPGRVVWLHVLPNVASPIIVRTTLGMGFTILTAAALGFLGLGAPPPTPEWGRTIAESREYLPRAWWYATAPGLAIFLVVMGFNLLGDGLRDVLDPRIRRGAQRG
jgi:peptide/nickel transport system permease protein